MSNPLYDQMQRQNPMSQLMQKLQQFQQTFRGDPREQVQRMLASGQVSQQQYNQAVQMANQLQQMLGRK